MFAPKAADVDELGPGEIGFIIAGIKAVADCKVGDTITDDRRPGPRCCRASSHRCRWCSAGCSRPMPPSSSTLRESLGKLRLNDASFEFETETNAPGLRLPLRVSGPAASGDRSGALEREFDLDLITTAPSVVYHVNTTNGARLGDP